MKTLRRIIDAFRHECALPDRGRGTRRVDRIIVHLIRHYGDAIMAKLSDATTRLDALTDQVGKIRTEVEALKAASQNMDTTPEFDAALDRLGTALQGVDELNEDAPTPAPGEGG